MVTDKKYPCPCCNQLTYSEPSEGSYIICPVCFWEDDPVQSQDLNYHGGANKVSLNEARKNYKKIGACTEEMLQNVRKPTKDKIND